MNKTAQFKAPPEPIKSISNLDNHLVGIAIGIRYRANFSIEDNLGKIVDQILYTKDAFFNPNVFTFTRANINDKTLYNGKTNDYMIINNSNVILEINFGKGNTFQKGDLKSIIASFQKEIIEGVLKPNHIEKVNRIGLVKRYIIQDKFLPDNFIRQTVGDMQEKITDINLSK